MLTKEEEKFVEYHGLKEISIDYLEEDTRFRSKPHKSLESRADDFLNAYDKIKNETFKNEEFLDSVPEKQPKHPKETIVIYTDGSCLGNPGRGGWAAVFKDKEISGGEKNTTNNRMELTAVIEALKLTTKGSRIELFTDSSYVKDGITSWIKSWKKNGWKTSSKKPVLNKDLWQTLDNLVNSRHVNFNWVKGHAGNYLIERCDQLARNRAQSANTETVITKIIKGDKKFDG